MPLRPLFPDAVIAESGVQRLPCRGRYCVVHDDIVAHGRTQERPAGHAEPLPPDQRDGVVPSSAAVHRRMINALFAEPAAGFVGGDRIVCADRRSRFEQPDHDNAGASRMSSVSVSRKASPQTAGLAAQVASASCNLSKTIDFWRSLTRPRLRLPASCSRVRVPWASLHVLRKHDAVTAADRGICCRCGRRNRFLCGPSTSAPTRSHRLAISFMNEIRVASMALAAYLVISAEE